MASPGDLVADRFRLLNEAGKGGTASVFRAFDMRENVPVALKLFDTKTVGDQIVAEICAREAKALERLDHPAIVRLVDVGRCTELGVRYIAVEWVEGKTLEDHLANLDPVSWETFWKDIGVHILNALTHAFERDVAHRDISLRNILIDESGQLRIIDFGQAKLKSVGIGVTVAGWKTPPYSPPEEDTGRYTYTRDPYSLAAIAVRACSGRQISNHDELYETLAGASFEPSVRHVLEKALQRDPKQRYENVLSLQEALHADVLAPEPEMQLQLWVRFVPVAFKWPDDGEPDRELLAETEERILGEMNEAVAVRLLPETDSRTNHRIQMETASHRLVVDIDSTHRDHLVVIGAAAKRFSLDGLYRGDAWLPNATFRLVGANHARHRAQAMEALAQFYEGIESHLLQEKTLQTGDTLLNEWFRVLDAMRELEAERVSPLKYKMVEAAGRRLTVDVENPWDAREEQLRTISLPGSPNWVFKGEIESVSGSRCTLYSPWFNVRTDDIPSEGHLVHDWSQTRKALDRQSEALNRFRARETPNEFLRKLLLREEKGNDEPAFLPVKKFHDRELNEEKKLLVSQFLGINDLLLIHGPPGTGKTKLIVELIHQELSRNPTARILLVSQTHVALDHVLVGVAGPDSRVAAVRIVSGTKGLSPTVEHCSVDARGRQLETDVDNASRKFLAAEAARVGVDHEEVALGLRASEVLRLRTVTKTIEEKVARLAEDLRVATAEFQSSPTTGTSTTRRDEGKAKLRSMDAALNAAEDELGFHKSQLTVASHSLRNTSKQGAQLCDLEDKDLAEWCDLLLASPERERLKKLMRIAEEWRLKFSTSDDFKAAIIASSRIVAGTCVGFCKEAAASQAEYDLCIVDESSKATTPELLLPLSRCKRAVLVGDHHQLPPFVEHALRSEQLQQKYNLSPNIFEAQLFESLQRDLANGQKGRLRFQHRMRGSIGRLVSHCFYQDELASGLSETEGLPFGDLRLAGLAHHVTWYNAPASQHQGVVERKVGKSFVNFAEAQCVVDLLDRLAFVLTSKPRGTKLPSIGVISGYAQQVESLSREIARRASLAKLDIECNSVHTFQGREVDICIYSIVRNNDRGDIGFLDDWRHLNVALSRARWYLVIVGSWPFCTSVRGYNPFDEVLRFISADGGCEVKPHG